MTPVKLCNAPRHDSICILYWSSSRSSPQDTTIS